MIDPDDRISGRIVPKGGPPGEDWGKKTGWTRFMEFMLNGSLKLFTVFNKVTGKDTVAMFKAYAVLGGFVSILYGLMAHSWTWMAFIVPLHLFMFIVNFKLYKWRVSRYVREQEGMVSFHVFPQTFEKHTWYGVIFDITFVTLFIPWIIHGDGFAGVVFAWWFLISALLQTQGMWYSKGFGPSLWARAKAKAKNMYESRARIPRLAPAGV